MASLGLGNLLGAVTQVSTAVSKERSLKSFLSTISKFGIQTKNNFEVNFSGLGNITFFVQSISIPGTKQNFTTLNYDGRVVDVPINCDWEHGFTMTVLNDAQGYIYSALTNFMLNKSSVSLVNSGYTMTIKALTGEEKHWAGALVTMRGVRLETISGLEWSYSDNSIQTFNITGKLIDFTYTPGALQKAAGFAGALDSIFGKGQ